MVRGILVHSSSVMMTETYHVILVGQINIISLFFIIIIIAVGRQWRMTQCVYSCGAQLDLGWPGQYDIIQ